MRGDLTTRGGKLWKQDTPRPGPLSSLQAQGGAARLLVRWQAHGSSYRVRTRALAPVPSPAGAGHIAGKCQRRLAGHNAGPLFLDRDAPSDVPGTDLGLLQFLPAGPRGELSLVLRLLPIPGAECVLPRRSSPSDTSEPNAPATVAQWSTPREHERDKPEPFPEPGSSRVFPLLRLRRACGGAGDIPTPPTAISGSLRTVPSSRRPREGIHQPIDHGSIAAGQLPRVVQFLWRRLVTSTR